MLRSLDIRNFAIIESIRLDFDQHLNIITGETGAGKSILMGALGLVLGKRADTQVLRDKEQKCVVEAVFDILGYGLRDFFEENDLDYEDATVIRREINTSGKSRAFINDQPVTLDILLELTGQLIDIHAQQESQQLLQPKFYLKILDHLSGNKEEIQSYKEDFQKLALLEKKLHQLEAELNSSKQEEDFLQFQYDELNSANLDELDINNIEQELDLLENAELVKTKISQAISMLDESEYAVSAQIREVNKLLDVVSSFNNTIASSKEMLEEWVTAIREMCRELTEVVENTAFDPEKIAILTDQQSALNKLLQKHHSPDMESLRVLRDQLADKLSSFSSDTERIGLLKIEIEERRESAYNLALKISDSRRALIPELESKVSNLLHELGMPYAFVEWKGPKLSKNDMNISGIDDIDLYFAPNKGSHPESLDKVGSGGEKSRLMLAIKSVLAGSLALPTLIFDEIDTGVSGSIAGKIGDIFTKLANQHQLISITHLPQVAAKGHKHFNVYKKHDKSISYTEIEVLEGEERIRAIAAMLSHENPGNAALQAARELMQRR